MSEATTKKVGCCSLCDKPIMDVIQTWTKGPLAGEVRQFGKFLPDVRRTTLVLVSGAHIDFSFCAICKATPENLPLIWQKMLLAAGLECSKEWRENHGLKPYDKRQEWGACGVLNRHLNDLPLGILRTRLWSEIENG